MTAQQYRDKVAHAIRDASRQLLDDKKKQQSISVPIASATNVEGSIDILPEFSRQYQTRQQLASITRSPTSMLLLGNMSLSHQPENRPFRTDQSLSSSPMAMVDPTRSTIIRNDAQAHYLHDNQISSIQDESSPKLHNPSRRRVDNFVTIEPMATLFNAATKKESTPRKAAGRQSTKKSMTIDMQSLKNATTAVDRKKPDNDDSSSCDSFVQQIDDTLGPIHPGI
jgi:hypothetical protein